jgi:DNA-binding response OmpR family regulator
MVRGGTSSSLAILLVDDEPSLLRSVARVFERSGHQIEACATAQEALEAVRKKTYDLIVTDWGLPDLEGVELVRRIRSSGKRVPILMLTGRTGADDLVSALDAGADDFLPKAGAPPAVLVARAEALIRRARYAPAAIRVEVGELVVDEGTRTASLRGAVLELTASELKVLSCLASACGEIVAREHIVASVWGDGADISENALDSVVKRLRRKLGDYADLITAVRMRGYVLARPPATSKASPRPRPPESGR